MPHIVVEHSCDIKDVNALLLELHQSLAGQETVSMDAIKTRSIPLEYAVVGENLTAGSMVHITLKLLPGRPDNLLQKMTNDLHAVVIKRTSEKTAVTVETVDLYKPSYKK